MISISHVFLVVLLLISTSSVSSFHSLHSKKSSVLFRAVKGAEHSSLKKIFGLRKVLLSKSLAEKPVDFVTAVKTQSDEKKSSSSKEYESFLKKESDKFEDKFNTTPYAPKSYSDKKKTTTKPVFNKSTRSGPDHKSKKTTTKNSASKRPPKRDSTEELNFAQTISINSDNMLPIGDLRASVESINVLRNKGFTALTPVQTQSYDIVYDGKDVVCRSKTGTGKTIAFGLPLIEKIQLQLKNQQPLTRSGSNLPKILILEPTRELAIQVTDELRSLCQPHNIKILTVYGGMSMSVQSRAIEKGVDVIVATPGRALDHIVRGSVDLSQIQTIVLDEGDTMLEMGFQKHVETIIANIKFPGEQARLAASRSLSDEDKDNYVFDDSKILADKKAVRRDVQMLLFSATIAGWIQQLTSKHMVKPVFLDALVKGETRLPEGISHVAMSYASTSALGKSRLKAVIVGLQNAIVGYSKGGQVIVFTNTKVEADNLVASPLLASFNPKVLHGGMTQGARQLTLKHFREKRIDVLIATDVAARGIDVDSVDLVVHTQPPDDVDTYVHRSGRTGRAGREGVAVTLHSSTSDRDRERLRLFETALKFSFARVEPSSPDRLLELSKQFSLRKEELAASRLNAIKEKKSSSAVTSPRSTKRIPDVSSADDLSLVTYREDIGNWAKVSEGPSIEENKLLRDLLRIEQETGVVSSMTEEQRERAILLMNRSVRKKEKRALYAAKKKSEKE